MKLEVVVSVSCDVCPTSALTAAHVIPEDWATVTITMAGAPRECHVCPRCMGDLLDPPDDISAEVRRFQLEDRIA